MSGGEDGVLFSPGLRDRDRRSSQKSVLFKGHDPGNTLGQEGASDEEIRRSTKTAQALDVVMDISFDAAFGGRKGVLRPQEPDHCQALVKT